MTIAFVNNVFIVSRSRWRWCHYLLWRRCRFAPHPINSPRPHPSGTVWSHCSLRPLDCCCSWVGPAGSCDTESSLSLCFSLKHTALFHKRWRAPWRGKARLWGMWRCPFLDCRLSPRWAPQLWTWALQSVLDGCPAHSAWPWRLQVDLYSQSEQHFRHLITPVCWVLKRS